MPKFQIEIEEILQRIENVEANDLDEALDIVSDKYENQEIILDSEDFKEHEIREYRNEVRILDLEKDSIFDIDYGKAILLDGNKELALIKKLNTKEYPYAVITGLKVNKCKTFFEWNNGSYFQNLSEACKKYEDLNKNIEKKNGLMYSELGESTLENNEIFKFNNLNEAFDFVFDYDFTKEDLVERLTEQMKEELVFDYAGERLIKENEKYYYNEDFDLFEKEMNNKINNVGKILNELNINDIKPIDIIELLEEKQLEFKPLNQNIVENISNKLENAGIKKGIEEFINYVILQLKYLEKSLRKLENEDEL